MQELTVAELLRGAFASYANTFIEAAYMSSVFQFSTATLTTFSDTSSVNTVGNKLNDTDAIVAAVNAAGPRLSASRRNLEGLQLQPLDAAAAYVTAALAPTQRALQLTLIPLNVSSLPPEPSSTTVAISFDIIVASPDAAATLAVEILALSGDPAKLRALLLPALTEIARLQNLTASDVSASITRSSVVATTLPYERSFWELQWAAIQAHIIAVIATSVSLMLLCVFLVGVRFCRGRGGGALKHVKRSKAGNVTETFLESLVGARTIKTVVEGGPLAIARDTLPEAPSGMTPPPDAGTLLRVEAREATLRSHVKSRLRSLLSPGSATAIVPAAAPTQRVLAWADSPAKGLGGILGLNLGYRSRAASHLASARDDPSGAASSTRGSLTRTNSDIDATVPVLRARLGGGDPALTSRTSTFAGGGSALSAASTMMFSPRVSRRGSDVPINLPGAVGSGSPHALEGRSLLILPPGTVVPEALRPSPSRPSSRMD